MLSHSTWLPANSYTTNCQMAAPALQLNWRLAQPMQPMQPRPESAPGNDNSLRTNIQYRCIYIYTYICTNVHTYTYIHPHTNRHFHLDIYIYMYMSVCPSDACLRLAAAGQSVVRNLSDLIKLWLCWACWPPPSLLSFSATLCVEHIDTYICIYIYIELHIYQSVYLSIYLSIYLYIYIYTYRHRYRYDRISWCMCAHVT